MKPFINQHSYSNLVKTTKTYFLLLSGGIALFILIFLLQLLSYFSKTYSESSSYQAATMVTAATTTTSGNNKNENKKDNKFVAVTTIAAPPADIEKPAGTEKPADVEKSADVVKVAALKTVAKSTVVLKAEKSFLKINDEKNDEIIKELSQVVEMRELHFKHGSFSLGHQKGMAKLDSSIQKCIEMPESWSKIVILGFTDNRGSKFVNVQLGLKRAKMLKTMLVKKGIPAEKITVASFGPELPIASNKTASGRAINRRVEFNLLASGG